MIELGLAYEHTNTKSDHMGGRKSEDISVRRIVKKEVNRLNQGAMGGQSTKTQCQTCSRKHVSGFDCPYKKYQKCFDCGESGHFKGAPVVRNLKIKRRRNRKPRLITRRTRKDK